MVHTRNQSIGYLVGLQLVMDHVRTSLSPRDAVDLWRAARAFVVSKPRGVRELGETVRRE